MILYGLTFMSHRFCRYPVPWFHVMWIPIFPNLWYSEGHWTAATFWRDLGKSVLLIYGLYGLLFILGAASDAFYSNWYEAQKASNPSIVIVGQPEMCDILDVVMLLYAMCLILYFWFSQILSGNILK